MAHRLPDFLLAKWMWKSVLGKPLSPFCAVIIGMGLKTAVSKLGGLGWKTVRPFDAIYNQYETKSRTIKASLDRFNNAFTLPERFKGTFVERWSEYWKAVYKDYTDVVVDAAKEMRDKPAKGVFLSALFGSAYYCGKRNPDEKSFRDAVISCSNDFIFVGAPIRNPMTTNHLKTLEQCFNEGIIRWSSSTDVTPFSVPVPEGTSSPTKMKQNKAPVLGERIGKIGISKEVITQTRFSFGVFSIIWVDNYRDCVGAYKATCKYLTPELLAFHNRIVDVGFLGRWWILEQKMIDCDINPNEWKEADQLT